MASIRAWLTAHAFDFDCSVAGRQLQSRADGRLHVRDADHPDRVPEQVAQRLAGEVLGHRLAGHAGEVPQAVDRPFQLADVAAQVARQELQARPPG